MQTFEARIMIKGHVMHVQIQAQNIFDARRMLEAQYGKNSIQGINPKR